MKNVLIALGYVLNKLPKTDWKPIPLCDVYGRYGLDAPNLVGHTTAPTVSTDATPTSITLTSAVFDTNNISNTGGATVTTRGICWVTGAGGTPTISNTRTTESGSFGTGNFSATATGLSSGTTYSVRAYATNSAGTGYGSTVEVTTDTNNPPTVVLNTEPVSGGIELYDAFQDASVDSSLWTNSNSTQVTETLDWLEITSTTGSGYYFLNSSSTYNLTGLSVQNELITAGNQSLTSLEVYPIMLQIDADNRLFFLVTNGSVIAYKRVSATSTSVWSDTYSASTHRFFRIRESSGTTYWDTSADGVTWTNRHSESNPLTVTALTVYVMAGTYAAEASATDTRFRNLNVSGYPQKFYFDGSDAAATDPNSVWTSESNAEDGSISTYAVTTATGSVSSNYIKLAGTNAPSDGATISSVRARLYYNWSDSGGVGSVDANIYSDSEAETLASIQSEDVNGSTQWSQWEVLSEPSGGWTWAKVQALEARAWSDAGHAIGQTGLYRIEVEVTTAQTDTTPTVYFTGTDPDADDIRYNVQIATNTSFSPTLVADEVSGTDSGFANEDSGGDTDPFNSGDQISYTVQSALSAGTYYWRVAGIDPSGTNSYGAWSDTSSFAVQAAGDDYTLLTNDTAQNLTMDTTTITQNHVLTAADTAQNLTMDTTTITQNHVIQPADLALSLTSDNTTVDITYTLETQDTAQSLTADATTITQNHVLVPSDLAHSLTEDTTTINQNHILPTNDLALSLTEDTTTINQTHVISTADLALSLTEDTTTINQNHVLSSADLALSLTEDATTINQNHVLPSADLALSLTSDNTTVSVASVTIESQDASLSLTSDNTTVDVNHIVATQDLALSLTEDATTITQNHVLSPADLALSLTSDNTTIDLSVILPTFDLAFSLTSDNTTITQNHILPTADMALALTADATTINQNYVLPTADLAFSLTTDNTTLDQIHVISVNDISMGLTSDNTTVDVNHIIATTGMTLSQLMDVTTLAQNHVLASADLAMSLTSDNTVVTQQDTIIQPNDMLFGSNVPNILFDTDGNLYYKLSNNFLVKL